MYTHIFISHTYLNYFFQSKIIICVIYNVEVLYITVCFVLDLPMNLYIYNSFLSFGNLILC